MSHGPARCNADGSSPHQSPLRSWESVTFLHVVQFVLNENPHGAAPRAAGGSPAEPPEGCAPRSEEGTARTAPCLQRGTDGPSALHDATSIGLRGSARSGLIHPLPAARHSTASALISRASRARRFVASEQRCDPCKKQVCAAILHCVWWLGCVGRGCSCPLVSLSTGMLPGNDPLGNGLCHAHPTSIAQPTGPTTLSCDARLKEPQCHALFQVTPWDTGRSSGRTWHAVVDTCSTSQNVTCCWMITCPPCHLPTSHGHLLPGDIGAHHGDGDTSLQSTCSAPLLLPGTGIPPPSPHAKQG